MPVRIRVSTELDLIAIEFLGVVSADELVGDVVPLLEEPSPYARMKLGLLDATAALGTKGSTELIRRIARNVETVVDPHVVKGARMALVATSDELFGLSRMYQMLRGEATVEIRVFRARADAVQWLGLPDDFATLLMDVTAG